MTSSVKHNLESIQTKIEQACLKSNRDAQSVQLIAVTKAVSVERTQESVDAGILHLGENRPEGFLEKVSNVKGEITWHYIGSLQTRKVKDVLPSIDVLHSLDRLSLANEIQKRATTTIDCFVQVNVSGEASKHGVAPDALHSFIKEIGNYPSIRIIGLMTMAPLTEDTAIVRDVFQKLKQLQVEIHDLAISYAPCTETSMGMSGDFEIAIEEGATYIRIGTSLVGE
ncbi:YggS family pyridoxal phosphate-dependent enzyme [Paenisporosarcina cavernae]|uniref:Pyridoxal phosphate homeostasis protein n=1 Tax=Paenisporosarcina cavernae TaxID=2320858 RepID=A0A385YYN2_9BACL|nr:YggS family pyridoxal phosphate-dependent enzyme [Paenisporosarcina cavernae]AYC30768.1 YggS family pyridoxal phosphate-dependent enzyme [Paenisporosarcina cavernae]